MQLDELKAKYFHSSIASFAGSKVTFLIDGEDFNQHFTSALSLVGGPGSSVGHYILIANWWLGLVGGSWIPPTDQLEPAWIPADEKHVPYSLDPVNGPDLLAVLIQKAIEGVDVRVMGWQSYPIMDRKAVQRNPASRADLLTMTAASIQALRAIPEIAGKAIFNILSHTAGAVHTKLYVVGTPTTAVGFTGGIDLVDDRYAPLGDPGHPDGRLWHDVVAKIEGPAVQGLYDWFRLYWNENREKDGDVRTPYLIRLADVDASGNRTGTSTVIPHIVTGAGSSDTPPLDPRSFASLATGSKHHVQSLRTVPAWNYGIFSPTPPKSGLPDAGIFEIRDAWMKAIQAAEQYIYMEDQSFWSADVFGWINKRVLEVPDLRVVLLMPGQSDPNDPAQDDFPVRCQTLNNVLFAGITAPADLARIRMFKRWGDPAKWGTTTTASVGPAGATSRVLTTIGFTKNLPPNFFAKGTTFLRVEGLDYLVVGSDATPAGNPIWFTVDNPAGTAIPTSVPAEIFDVQGIFVHTKSTLIDDHWALIGSANCMQRSLYTDVEHAVGVVDEDDLLVKQYRTRLWAHHFRHPDSTAFDDIEVALHAWEPTWFATRSGPTRPARTTTPGPEYIQPVSLPLAIPPGTVCMGEQYTHLYNMYLDTDSRETWSLSISDLKKTVSP